MRRERLNSYIQNRIRVIKIVVAFRVMRLFLSDPSVLCQKAMNMNVVILLNSIASAVMKIVDHKLGFFFEFWA